MHPAKLALIRCENLDLFSAQVSAPAAAREPVEAAPAEGEPGFLFRIGPDDQLDLFRHSPAEIAATEVRRAIRARSVDQARRQLSGLRGAPAYARFIDDCDQCIELIERQDPRWRSAAHAVAWLEADLWPAASRCLQRDAMLLVRPALLAVLEGADGQPFDPERPQAHASYIWHLRDQPAQAVAALEADPQWSTHAAALSWHARWSESLGWHDRVHADVAELCFAWPQAAETWLSASPAWATRWSAWCDLDEAMPLHAFPAWCRLTRASEFPPPAATDQRPGAQLMRIAQQLAEAATDMPLRKALNALCPALLAAFLSARTARAG